MKRTITLLLIIAITGMARTACSQILTPVHWSYAAKRTGNNEAKLFLKATIDDGWHLYSVNQKDGGPVKTTFAFNAGKAYSLVGNVNEPRPVTKYEKTFEMEVMYFEHSVVFGQKIKLKGSPVTVSGKLTYMVCNDHQCLPPESVDFSVPVK
jgi:DsbC/DsbD-like thiol-disulfide interchange protein